MLKTTPRVKPHCAKYTRSAGQHWSSSYFRYTHKYKAPQMYVSWLGYHLTILWHHSSSGTCVSPIIFTQKIYDVPMKFARKLIHGGPVHHCYEQQFTVLSECMQDRWFYLHGINIDPS